jgi:hypothetical protein
MSDRPPALAHPPVHLPADAIRREGEDGAQSKRDVEPLFRQAGLDLDAP